MIIGLMCLVFLNWFCIDLKRVKTWFELIVFQKNDWKKNDVSWAQYEMSIFDRKRTFMLKTLVGSRECRSKMNFPKLPPKSKVIFLNLFFDREELPKKGVLQYKPCPRTSSSSKKS
jgi:hypothetical protein